MCHTTALTLLRSLRCKRLHSETRLALLARLVWLVAACLSKTLRAVCLRQPHTLAVFAAIPQRQCLSNPWPSLPHAVRGKRLSLIAYSLILTLAYPVQMLGLWWTTQPRPVIWAAFPLAAAVMAVVEMCIFQKLLLEPLPLQQTEPFTRQPILRAMKFPTQ